MSLYWRSTARIGAAIDGAVVFRKCLGPGSDSGAYEQTRQTGPDGQSYILTAAKYYMEASNGGEVKGTLALVDMYIDGSIAFSDPNVMAPRVKWAAEQGSWNAKNYLLRKQVKLEEKPPQTLGGVERRVDDSRYH